LAEETPTVLLNDIAKRFGDTTVLHGINLRVERGEFFSILGPSGCGKTTTLKLIGGFMFPDEGKIMLSGNDVTNVPPYRRDVNTVFQSYALFEHLNVSDNIAFGLRRKRVPKPEIARRVRTMLELVRLSDRATARPGELSGGQQQRVALARALVNEPSLLLLDEPLGALDLKLRREMQVELKTIQRTVGITFVFVTHDQEEALTMSDRIAVMNSGRVEQVGSAVEIYDHPANAFVADFIGTANIFDATVQPSRLDLGGGLTMNVSPERLNGIGPQTRVRVSVRPEKILVRTMSGEPCIRFKARVVDAVYLGATSHVTLKAADTVHLAAVTFHPGGETLPRLVADQEVEVGWLEQDALILPWA
jgi:spermidine/putrescine transport system ATP-binding protein